MELTKALFLLASGLATTYAQGFGGYNNGSPFSNSNGNDGDDGGSGNGSGFGPYGDLSTYRTKLIAHAVLATLAFGFFFPVGGIIIRLASCRGLWWMHGLFQLMAYVLYIAAFAIGIYMVRITPSQLNIMNNAHPIIGIVLFILLIFQPLLGLIHHLMFKKYSRRTVWSYGHLWLGRIVITLGIINGGLGLKLARNFPLEPAGKGPIIGYSVAAGIMWLLYVVSAIVGESRRRKVKEVAPQTYKEAHAESRGSGGRHDSQKIDPRERYA